MLYNANYIKKSEYINNEMNKIVDMTKKFINSYKKIIGDKSLSYVIDLSKFINLDNFKFENDIYGVLMIEDISNELRNRFQNELGYKNKVYKRRSIKNVYKYKYIFK